MRTVIPLAFLLVFGPRAAAAQVTAFLDARIIDGTGGVIERGTVVVRDGVIVDVGPSARVRAPEGAVTVDLRGKTLMPGIVNAHGHLAPVEGLKTDPAYYTRANLLRQLRTYATYGVTTVFALGDDGAEAFALREEQAAAPPDRARVFLPGPASPRQPPRRRGPTPKRSSP